MKRNDLILKKRSLEYFFKKSPLIKKLKRGRLITSRIISIKKKFLVVESGLKSESYIKIEEFYDFKKNLNFKVGDYIVLYIESLDNGFGKPLLSRTKFKDFFIWKYFSKILKKGLNVKGRIMSKIKGGFAVSVKDFKCFLPYSATDRKILLNFNFYEDKLISFRIININRKKKNVVLSRKLITNKIVKKKKKELFNKLKVGKTIKGIVKNMSYYYVMVSLGYINGIILAKNLTWGPRKYPNEILKINQTVKTKILKIDKLKNRVYLGIKQLTVDPWRNINKRYKVNNIVYARVYKITNEALFFIFEKGVYSYVSKYKLLKKKVGLFIINNIRLNDYIKLKILKINKKKRFFFLKIFYKQFCP